jgi:hypothetical protein
MNPHFDEFGRKILSYEELWWEAFLLNFGHFWEDLGVGD